MGMATLFGTSKSLTVLSLGFLFRAQPTLLTAEPSTLIMDSILSSNDDDARARLLRIIQEFLSAEAEKHAMKEREKSKNKGAVGSVNMEELIGNTDGFAESGYVFVLLVASNETQPSAMSESPLPLFNDTSTTFWLRLHLQTLTFKHQLLISSRTQ